ncbi:MAG: hypothetical protein EGS78_08795 [Bacteroidales bacterium]|nr:hypothetical protein [Bacteroidales bacterium]
MLLRGLCVGLGIPKRTKFNPVKFLKVTHGLSQALQIGRTTVPAVLDGGSYTKHVLDLGNGGLQAADGLVQFIDDIWLCVRRQQPSGTADRLMAGGSLYGSRFK